MEKMDRIRAKSCRSYGSVVRCICFVCLLVVVLCNVFYVLRFKNFDGIYNFEKFYQLEDNSVDVLVLGSSHAFETFNTGYWYENYGIAGYVLGGSAQPIWNTYFYLKEALKTQRPEVIVLEGYSLARWTEDYGSDVFIIKNTYGIKDFGLKFENLLASTPEGKLTRYFPEYMQSHSRYSELGKKDFIQDQGGVAFYKNWHGFNNVTRTTPCEKPDVDGYIERIPLPDKNEKYFRMILELAQNEKVPIIVMIAPYANGMTPEHQMKYNTAKDIANEYGVNFINFNSSEMYNEIGLDFETDFNDGEHLNHIGNVKVSMYAANYILAMIDVPDRRDDPRYFSWELDAAYVNALNRDAILSETSEIKKIVDIFDSSEYIYLVSHNTTESSEQIDDLKKYFGIPITARGEYIVDSTSGKVTQLEEYMWYNLEGISFKYGWGGFLLKHSSYHQENGNIDYLDSFYSDSAKGMRMVIYDKVTMELADTFCIDIDNDMCVIR